MDKKKKKTTLLTSRGLQNLLWKKFNFLKLPTTEEPGEKGAGLQSMDADKPASGA
jgi:hypothetical protein